MTDYTYAQQQAWKHAVANGRTMLGIGDWLEHLNKTEVFRPAKTYRVKGTVLTPECQSDDRGFPDTYPGVNVFLDAAIAASCAEFKGFLAGYSYAIDLSSDELACLARGIACRVLDQEFYPCASDNCGIMYQIHQKR